MLQVVTQNKNYINWSPVQSYKVLFLYLEYTQHLLSSFFACRNFEGAYFETATLFYRVLNTISFYLVHEYCQAILFMKAALPFYLHVWELQILYCKYIYVIIL